MWFIGIKVEQETSAAPPKKNPGSVPERAPASASETHRQYIQAKSQVYFSQKNESKYFWRS